MWVLLLLPIIHAILPPEDAFVGDSWSYDRNPTDPFSDPNYWGYHAPFERCRNGYSQSPLDILSSTVIHDTKKYKIQFSPYSRDGCPSTLTYNGKYLSADVSCQNVFFSREGLAGQRLLKEIRFHGKAEHRINGDHFEIEMQLIFQRISPIELRDQTIISVLLSTGGLTSPFLNQFSEVAPNLIGLPLGSYLPLSFVWAWEGVLDFYQYHGSTTTPPCTEVVHWMVAAERLSVHPDQLTNILRVMGGQQIKYRPPQPVNDRRIDYKHYTIDSNIDETIPPQTYTYSMLSDVPGSDPDRWEDYWPRCGGISQSPLNLTTETAIPSHTQLYMKATPAVNQPWALATVYENNGLELRPMDGLMITLNSSSIGGSDFILKKIQFKALPEHGVDNKPADAEMQVLFEDDKGRAASIGIRLKVGVENAMLKPMTDVMENIRRIIYTPFIMNFTIPFQSNWFFEYDGSYTAPPCYETMTWFVMKQEMTISPRQLELMRVYTYANGMANVRPTQETANRTIYLRYSTIGSDFNVLLQPPRRNTVGNFKVEFQATTPLTITEMWIKVEDGFTFHACLNSMLPTCRSNAIVSGLSTSLYPPLVIWDEEQKVVRLRWVYNQTLFGDMQVEITNTRYPNHCDRLSYSFDVMTCTMDNIQNAGLVFVRKCLYRTLHRDGSFVKETSIGTPTNCNQCNACFTLISDTENPYAPLYLCRQDGITFTRHSLPTTCST